MITIFCVLVIILGLITWIGQTISFFAPTLAEKLGVSERKSEIDDSLYIVESKAMGLMDFLTTWTMPLAGVLLLLENTLWPYFGLVGASIYLYYSGVIIFSRIYLKSYGKKIGSIASVKTAYIYGMVSIVVSLIMIAMAVNNLTVHQ